ENTTTARAHRSLTARRRAGAAASGGLRYPLNSGCTQFCREESQAMKAIRVSEYGGPEVLKLADVPTPEPGTGQVLVRNPAVGVKPVDTSRRSNTDNRGPKLPYTPGSDAAGVVEAVGSGVTAVKAGDRVYMGGTQSGAYAELSLCDQGQVHPLPAAA